MTRHLRCLQHEQVYAYALRRPQHEENSNEDYFQYGFVAHQSPEVFRYTRTNNDPLGDVKAERERRVPTRRRVSKGRQ